MACSCRELPAGPAQEGHGGPRGAAGADVRRHPAVQAGVRRRVHGVPRHGRVLTPLVCRGAPGTDGLPHQKAACRGGNPLWQGKDLPPREMRGQDQEEILLGELAAVTPRGGGKGDRWEVLSLVGVKRAEWK